MPINIYKTNDGRDQIAWLCDDNWDISFQISELEKWLIENENLIEPAGYVADVGFEVRKEATGGGAVVSVVMMRIMADLGMELFLSEYGEDFDDYIFVEEE